MSLLMLLWIIFYGVRVVWGESFPLSCPVPKKDPDVGRVGEWRIKTRESGIWCNFTVVDLNSTVPSEPCGSFKIERTDNLTLTYYLESKVDPLGTAICLTGGKEDYTVDHSVVSRLVSTPISVEIETSGVQFRGKQFMTCYVTSTIPWFGMLVTVEAVNATDKNVTRVMSVYSLGIGGKGPLYALWATVHPNELYKCVVEVTDKTRAESKYVRFSGVNVTVERTDEWNLLVTCQLSDYDNKVIGKFFEFSCSGTSVNLKTRLNITQRNETTVTAISTLDRFVSGVLHCAMTSEQVTYVGYMEYPLEVCMQQIESDIIFLVIGVDEATEIELHLDDVLYFRWSQYEDRYVDNISADNMETLVQNTIFGLNLTSWERYRTSSNRRFDVKCYPKREGPWWPSSPFHLCKNQSLEHRNDTDMPRCNISSDRIRYMMDAARKVETEIRNEKASEGLPVPTYQGFESRHPMGVSEIHSPKCLTVPCRNTSYIVSRVVALLCILAAVGFTVEFLLLTRRVELEECDRMKAGRELVVDGHVICDHFRTYNK